DACEVACRTFAEQEGVSVFMLNTGQDENPVGGRDEQAERAGCSHYLSIHCNAGPASSRGTETLYRDSNDILLAAKVQKATVQSLRLRDRGLKPETVSPHGRLAIFDFDGQAALVELGFITNNTDRAAILSDENRKLWARAVVEGLYG
ncbi:MAG: N-acetylmuramoyl-L-alanine amidase, partial [Armatimonadota bacterium]